MSGGAVGQRGGLAGGPRRVQRGQQPGHGDRGVEADVSGGAVGQRGDLAVWPPPRAARASSPATATGASRPT